MKNWQNILRRLAATLDAAGVTGIGLVVFAGAIYLSAVLPAQRELQQLQMQSAQRQRGGPAADGLRTAAMRGVDQLEQFNKNFPPLSEAPALVLKLHEIAAANSLTLDTGEYQMLADRDAALTRYQVTLPLRGTYWQVRLFVAQVLDELPASALEEISIKRESVGAKGIETRVRFTLYLGGTGGVGGGAG